MRTDAVARATGPIPALSRQETLEQRLGAMTESLI